MKQFLTVIFAFSLSVYSYTQLWGQEADYDKAKMDSLFSLIEENQKGMGSLSIFRDGEEVYQRAFGYADVQGNIKATPDTKYRIGSISKLFTATLILKLIDEGKLRLETPLAEFFPSLKNAEKITVEHLLRHRSGIFNITSAPDYQDWMEEPKSRKEMLDIIASHDTTFEPDTKAAYSNTNYILLAFIVEEIEKTAFSEVLKDRITEPLGLENTYYGGKIQSENKEAHSYQPGAPWKKATETDMSIPGGAGAIVSTPTDLNTFFHALFSDELLSENSFRQMTRIVDNFGMGLFQIPFYDKTALGHNGGIDGFQSNAAYFPEEKVAIAYTSNGVILPINDILIGALSIYFDKPYALPEFKEGLKLSSEELDAYLGTYSSPDFPLKLTITKDEQTLIGQATGQPSFPLEAYDTHVFTFIQAGLTLEFDPDSDTMILIQGAGKFKLSREKEVAPVD
ncbi:CubicO group peptidase, beta-lactamase class C family [Cyclobacterium lianum]|uniref:CubicO group peptidase, beta-lactamase class C family n=1 Tax=Cyclobacterium lianum TaxID=388280 RepID=A0A1M7PFY1_9BACT|nr:serine hydrolase domain-containing protein [Cyclobacterium lianum]SHN15920.1 CubicO group peptidase, beta-lactamase class C family [Cyclobacterium lianum]